MMGVRLTAVAAAVLCGLLCSSAPAFASDACPGDDQQPTSDSAGQAALNLVCDINQIRVSNGLPSLNWSWQIWQASDWMANDEAHNHYVSHIDSTGHDVDYRIAPTGYFDGYSDWMVLENLGWGSGPYSTPQSVAQGWMNSPGHRTNILDPDIHDVAVGIAEGSATPDGADGFFYVMDFGNRGDKVQPTRRAQAARCRRSSRRPRRFCSSHIVW